MHARPPARRHHGLVRRRVRGLLRLPAAERLVSERGRDEGAGDDAPFASCPIPSDPDDRILLGHGSGGRLPHRLLEELILPAFDNPILARRDDQAVLEVGGARLAFTTDSFVVSPLFFPGGDIGALAVHGTVNDLAMAGARPLYLSASFILE